MKNFRFWIDSTDKSGGLYHQEILGQRLAAKVQQEAERRFNPVGIRDRLLAKRNQKGYFYMLRLLDDENFNSQIVRGILRRNPNVDKDLM